MLVVTFVSDIMFLYMLLFIVDVTSLVVSAALFVMTLLLML